MLLSGFLAEVFYLLIPFHISLTPVRQKKSLAWTSASHKLSRWNQLDSYHYKKQKWMVELSNLVTTGWPESMQDLPQHLHPYWCFCDKLTILDGLVVKGNRVIIPTSMRPDTLSRLHDAHQGITSTLQHARWTVYWPKLQSDITKMVQACEECQRHGNKKSRIPERQIAAIHPMEIVWIW